MTTRTGRAAPLLAVEGRVWASLLAAATGRGAPSPDDFTYRDGLRPLLLVVLALLTGEGLIVEAVLLVVVGHGVWAWAALGLHLYALAWTGGLLASVRVLPHHVGREAIELRDAVVGTLTVPYLAVAAVRARRTANVGRSGLRVDGSGHALYAHGDATVLIELRPGARVLLDGEPYPHRISTLAVTVDDPAGFVRAVADRLSTRAARP